MTATANGVGGSIVNGVTGGGGGGGAALPDTPANVLLDAGNADTLVALAAGTGAGVARSYIDAFQSGAVAAIGAEVAGTALIADGLGDIGTTSADVSAFLASANAAPALASIGGGAGPTILYADDCTAEAGSESASITGTGASSTFTLTAGSTARTYGTAGATAARIVCPIPAGARVIEVEIGLTASNLPGISRFLTIAHRNELDGAAPAQLYGISIADNAAAWYNDLMGGGNGGSKTFTSPLATTAADRWFRVTINPREPGLGFAAGSGSGGARPTAWAPMTSPTSGMVPPYGTPFAIADTDAVTAIAIVLQSFGGGSASSITASLRGTVVQ